MIDLRGILSNWFKNKFCPSTRLFRLRAQITPAWFVTWLFIGRKLCQYLLKYDDYLFFVNKPLSLEVVGCCLFFHLLTTLGGKQCFPLKILLIFYCLLTADRLLSADSPLEIFIFPLFALTCKRLEGRNFATSGSVITCTCICQLPAWFSCLMEIGC